MLDISGLHVRAALFRSLRNFFSENGFLEVDTPIRQKIILPESNILPVESGDAFLQTSPELCMKRLLAAGCEKIFQICPCFRREEKGSRHLEEFTMLEWYRSGEDYTILMRDCEKMVNKVAHEVQLSCEPDTKTFRSLTTFGKLISREWQKLTVHEAYERYAPVNVETALKEDRFDELLVEYIEPNLGFENPVILFDYPVELASLARRKHQLPTLAERFELYICGLELANGFSELTDSGEQRARFQNELDIIAARDGRLQTMPEQFLKDIDKIHSAAGIAFGVDRLLMIMCGEMDISNVVPCSLT